MPRLFPADIAKMHPRTLQVVAVALLAAIGAASARAEPTGTAIWDGLLKAALGVVVVAAASKAPRWAVIVFATVAASAAGISVVALFGWLSLGIAIASSLQKRRSRLFGAFAASLAIQVLLRLPAFGFFGLPSMVAGAACALVIVTGYQYGTTPARRFARHSLGVLGLLATTTLMIGGIVLLDARADVDSGVGAARRGLAAARSGDTSGVVQELERAEEALDRANSRARGFGARALRLIPVASQHQRTIESATSVGALVVGEAATMLTEVNIENLSLASGSVDLGVLQRAAPRLRSMLETLSSASTSLGAAQSAWVVPAIGHRVAELAQEIDELRPEIQVAADAAEALPVMLGVDGAQSYFVFFGTPAESRELGGFFGSWAILRFDNGRLELAESGRTGDLYAIAAEAAIAPGTVSDWYLAMARPTVFPQNLTGSSDFAQVADVSRQVLAGISEEPLAGFVYLDAWALIDLLELTGPVQIPFQEAALTSENAAQYFFNDQYLVGGPSERTEVFDTLAGVAGEVLQRVQTQTLPGPEELGRVMGPSARAGHMQVVTFNEEHNNFLRSVKLLRDFGRHDTKDFVGLVQTNGLSNKMDLYLERALDYQVTVGADGFLAATATATLRSVVPADAPEVTLGLGEERGVNRVLLSLYTPQGLTGASVDGAAVEPLLNLEFDLARYLVEVDVLPTGEPVVVEFSLSGSLPPGDEYSLEVWHQPLVNTDQVIVSVQGAGMEIDWSGPLVENLVIGANTEVSRE